MPDFEELMKLTEDCTKEQVREQEISRIREIQSRENKGDPERTRRFVEGCLSRRWSWRMKLDETYRAPSLFTWRC
jgi:hypothetical protein